MILTLESLESVWKPLEVRSKKTQDVLKSSKCANCKDPLGDNQKIDFVECANGEIVWWHFRSPDVGSTCTGKEEE